MKIRHHKILVTGGSSGIGLALAKKLISENNMVAITGRSVGRLEKAKREVPGLIAIQADVTIEEGRHLLVEEVDKQLGGLSFLVNSAGALEYSYFGKDPQFYSRIRYEMEVNYFAPIRLIELFMPLLSNNKAAGILTISSGGAYVPVGITAGYSASKSAIHMFLRALRYQFQHSDRYSHIGLFEASPPPIATDMASEWEETAMMKKMKPDDFADRVVKGIRNDEYIMNIGITRMVYWLSRITPRFLEKMFNKQMEALIPTPDFSKPNYRKVATPFLPEEDQLVSSTKDEGENLSI